MNFEISSVSGIILSCRKTYDLSWSWIMYTMYA
jgi:hypothetical protein